MFSEIFPLARSFTPTSGRRRTTFHHRGPICTLPGSADARTLWCLHRTWTLETEVSCRVNPGARKNYELEIMWNSFPIYNKELCTRRQCGKVEGVWTGKQKAWFQQLQNEVLLYESALRTVKATSPERIVTYLWLLIIRGNLVNQLAQLSHFRKLRLRKGSCLKSHSCPWPSQDCSPDLDGFPWRTSPLSITYVQLTFSRSHIFLSN